MHCVIRYMMKYLANDGEGEVSESDVKEILESVQQLYFDFMSKHNIILYKWNLNQRTFSLIISFVKISWRLVTVTL